MDEGQNFVNGEEDESAKRKCKKEEHAKGFGSHGLNLRFGVFPLFLAYRSWKLEIVHKQY